jgi:hypothetical protein
MIAVLKTRRATALAALALAFASCLPAAAQPAASYSSGGEFYLAYRAAFDQATSFDELLPWAAKARREQIAKAPTSERAEAFAMVKMFDDRINVTVVKETPSASGAELQVEGISAESRGKATGVVTLVKEDGAWKIDRENWTRGAGR